MTWQSHAAIGANVIWIIPALGEVDRLLPLYLIIAILGALLPDIDAGGSASKGKYGAKIHYIGYGFFKPLIGAFRHRGFFHSLLFVIGLFIVSLPLAVWIGPFAPAMLALGYLSHLFIDQWNGGMQFFYPIKKDVSLVPRRWQFRVGSTGDWLFLFLGVFGLLAFFYLYREAFFVQTSDIQKLLLPDSF